jgi:2-polyprenyl-6-methoxyphenol hydroxylase-like FAD-dependent oxidoreductase
MNWLLLGDILIGADGIGSPVRSHILNNEPVTPKYSGALSLGCVVDRSQIVLPPDLQLPAFLYARSGTILIFALDDKTIQWATTSRIPERDRHEWEAYRTSGQAAERLRSDWGGITAEPIQSMIRNVSSDNIRLWAPYEVPGLPRWHTERTCVLGDAAHAIPPSAGQGAAQAFEDVGVMTRLLSSTTTESSYGQIFERFESLRKPRVDSIRKMTRNAESSRGATTSGWGWFVKSNIIRGAFMLLGKGKESNLSSGVMSGYDFDVEWRQ